MRPPLSIILSKLRLLLLLFLLLFTHEAEAREPILVAFGDSLTAGLGVPIQDAYPALLEQKIKQAGYPYRVINSGVSGETTAGGIRRLEWVLQTHPEIVILELGANDGLRGLDLKLTQKNLATLIERLLNQNIQVVLAGMKIPMNYGQDYGKRFENIYPDLAHHYHLPFIPFFLEGVAGQITLNQPDGIHPTAEGYRRIVEEIWPILQPLLKRQTKHP